MGRFATISFQGVAVTAIQDLFEIVAAAGKPFRVHDIEITNDSQEASEQLSVQLKRGIGNTSGSGGSAGTEYTHDSDDTAVGVTSAVNNTTQAVAGGGSLEIIERKGSNIINGWEWHFTPEGALPFKDDETFIVSLPVAPAASVTMSGKVVIEEL